MGNTKVDLIIDLEKCSQNAWRDEIIARAKRGAYHDYESDEFETPKIQLVEDLRKGNFLDLMKKTMNGGYDDEQPSPEMAAKMDQQLKDMGLRGKD